MTITIDADLIALIAIGLLAGTLAAMLFDRNRGGDSRWLRNIIVGVAGAFLGSLVFDILGLRDDIPEMFSGTITLADVVVAFVGASLIMFFARRYIPFL